MEKNLLSKLDPKGKEHQRKKVLRLFFSWNSKQEKLSQRLCNFWDWVKKLSPDNLNSPDRFKSMSYEFLDKLLSKKVFREKMQHWIEEIYMPTLTKSIEDEHTHYFLQFIISSIHVKVFIEENKEKYLETAPELPQGTEKIIKNLETPSLKGGYIEYVCENNVCGLNKIKSYGWIGIDIQVNISQLSQNSKCPECDYSIAILNIGIFNCKYFLNAETSENTIETLKDMVNFYTTLDEIHFFPWTHISISIKSLSPEEKTFLEGLVLTSFNDPTVPKKKYCKRKIDENEGKNDIQSSILELEKEIKDLDSMIYDLIADNYKNKKLIEELEQNFIGSPVNLD